MNNKLILGITIAATIAIIFFAGCTQQQPENGKEIKIGALVPLTGNYSVLGNRIKNGMELAKQDLLVENPNKQIELVFEDACQPKDAVTAIQKMIEVDKINLIGGSFCLVGLVPIIPITEEKKMIVFNTAANPDSVLNHPYVFSTNKSIKSDAAGMANFALQKLNAKTAVTVFYNTPLGQDFNKHLTETFIAGNGTVLSTQMVELNAVDFRTELTKIKEQKPDVIFIIQLSNSLGLFLKQAKELGIEAKIMSHSEAEDPNVLATAAEAAEGFIISSSEPKIKTKEILDFKEKYSKAFGAEPDILAATAYDSLKLQVIAFEKCNGSSDCMAEEFHKTKNYAGASGNITINANGSSDKPTNFKIVKNGKFVPYEGN
ncbi:MAG: ABC transporter substrate-binding protein [Candidatus ainarchaeum sp.]|nr:ABC transporter substrate-binding protein [Candidatus ainarchaeum sp.]